MPATPLDVESLQLCLRLAAAPDHAAYKVTLELSEIDLVVEAVDLDLRGAITGAACRCARRLRQRGYAVTSFEIVQALDQAMANSELGQGVTQGMVRGDGPSELRGEPVWGVEKPSTGARKLNRYLN